MSQVTEQSVRFQTALACSKLIQASGVLDITEDDFDFLTSNKVWIATDRSRARRCVEACVYFFFSSRRRHTSCSRDWSSDVCSSDLKDDFAPSKLCAVRNLTIAAPLRKNAPASKNLK